MAENTRMTPQQVVEAFVSLGWSPAVATGIAQNAIDESNLNPRARGDGGRSHGMFQWQPPRQRAIEQHFGKRVLDMSPLEQIQAAHWEMTQGPERHMAARLRDVTDPGVAASIVSRYYERPLAATEAARNRGRNADRLWASLGGENMPATSADPFQLAGGETPSGELATSQTSPLPVLNINTAQGQEFMVPTTPQERSRFSSIVEGDFTPDVRQAMADATALLLPAVEAQDQYNTAEASIPSEFDDLIDRLVREA